MSVPHHFLKGQRSRKARLRGDFKIQSFINNLHWDSKMVVKNFTY